MTNLRAGLLIALFAAVTGAACGSSSTTSTAPSTVPRCSVSLAETDLSVPASGGSGSINVTAARECAWTANSNASWLTLRGAPNGQGDGKVDYLAAANSDPAMRRGVIELNDKQATVTQAAADCVMQLADSSESYSQTGGSGTIVVQASSGTCSWTAVSDSSWIVIKSGASGSGNGTVAYDVVPLSGAPRAGTVLVAGLRFSITQSENCTYTASPTTYTPGSAGGSTTIAVGTTAGCPWTAASNVPWATVSPATGSGPANVQVSVDATSGPPRIGSLVVAGQVVSISQGAACSFTVDPLNHTFGSQGGPGSATIQAPSGCAWSASSDVAWITLTTATTGSGNGAIGFSVDSLSGPARSGTISLAGTQITITQGSGCSISIAPTSASVPSSGGSGSVAVTAGGGCPWTASSNASWLTVTAGASGSGNGTIQYSAAATSSVARTAVLTIGGQTFTVNQGSGCSIALSASGANVPAGGAKNTVDVSTGPGCPWTATSGVSWLTIGSGSSGSGPGTVAYTVDASSGPQRSGVLTIGGQTFTVTQANGCAISLSPTGASAPAAGAKSSVGVTAGAGCPWNASSGVPWMTITSGGSGNGNGTVSYTVDATTGPARSGSLTIGGQTFTVSQASGCSYQLSQTSFNVGPVGGTRSVSIKVDSGCTWTSTSNASWITVTNGSSGNGSGSTEFVISPNVLASRTGTVTVAGQTVTINQN